MFFLFFFFLLSQVLIRKYLTIEDTAGLAWNNIPALTATAAVKESLLIFHGYILSYSEHVGVCVGRGRKDMKIQT